MLVRRRPIKDLKKKLDSGELETYPWSNELPVKERPEEIRWFFYWQRSIARKVFGPPDCTYRGWHYYRLYSFEAILENDVQRFILWCDPDKANKGSNIELIKPINKEMIAPIIQWFEEERKRYAYQQAQDPSRENPG